MKVEELFLRNFRNIKEMTFCPDRGINFLVGSNGQGKTSLLEALGFLATLRSFRESKLASLLCRGTLNSELSCSLTSNGSETDPWRTRLQVLFEIESSPPFRVRKTASINQKPYKSSTQYLSQRFGSYQLGFHVIVFNPSDHDLIRGDPSIRRNYLNRVLCAEDVHYLGFLQKYQRVLMQRNAILKMQSFNLKELFQDFTEQLCEYSCYLVYKRLEWIDRLNEILGSIVNSIAPKQPELRTIYLSRWAKLDRWARCAPLDSSSNRQGQVVTREHLEQSFWSQFSALKETEWKAGHTLIGPHRDDWLFTSGDEVLKGYGSQGEIRSALLALKLSEIELFRKETDHQPLFLLDDFSSELDQEKRLFLLNFLEKSDLQTFVTTTEDSLFVGSRYWVHQGKIAAVKEERLTKEGLNDERSKSVRME